MLVASLKTHRTCRGTNLGLRFATADWNVNGNDIYRSIASLFGRQESSQSRSGQSDDQTVARFVITQDFACLGGDGFIA
jgi:hypothetical protein